MGAQFGKQMTTGRRVSSGNKLIISIVLLLVLVVAIVIVAIGIAMKKNENADLLKFGQVQSVSQEQQIPSGSTQIFVTKQRIEEGTLIDPDTMLRPEKRELADVSANMFQTGQRGELMNSFYARMMINTDTPLLKDYLTTEPPINQIKIPAG